MVPDVEVLGAIPSLKTVDYEFKCNNILGAAPFLPVIGALQRGVGLQFLQEVKLLHCKLGNAYFSEFLEALECSGCADRMTVLSCLACDIGIRGVRALADLLRRDKLPALKRLLLGLNYMITDVGVVALTEALEEAPRTLLVDLDLSYIWMEDVGMAALASLVHRGRMHQVQVLDL